MDENNSTPKLEKEAVTTIACKVCSEEIKNGAAKCVHCGSYQDWTRYVLRWTTLSVSLLSIMPLWGIAISIYNLSSKHAEVEAAIISCNHEEIVMAFANSGKIDGIITDAKFELVYDNTVIKPKYEVHALEDDSSFVVSPNLAPKLVTYKPYISNTPTVFVSRENNYSSCSIKATIDWVDFKGAKNKFVRKCKFP